MSFLGLQPRHRTACQGFRMVCKGSDYAKHVILCHMQPINPSVPSGIRISIPRVLFRVGLRVVFADVVAWRFRKEAIRQ